MIVTNNPHVMTVTSNLVITAAAQLAYTMIEDMTDYASINIPNYNTITQIPDEYKPSKINTCLATEWENAFANMQALTSFPESFYDISNAVNMANLCRGDENLITPPNLSGGTNIINLAYAYVACNNLSVTPELPPNVEDIDGMFGLTNITDMPQIPESVTNMNLTFSGCKNLVNTQNIPEGVVSLEETFAECTSLVSSPVLPQNGQLTNLFATFLGCSNLQEPPIIPNTVTNLGRTFERCSNLLNPPEIPNSVISMMNTFDNSGISSFPNIPSGVSNLGGCFSNCVNLTGTLVISDEHNFSCEGIFNNSTKEKVIIFNGHGNNYNTNFNMIEAIGGERPYISDGPFIYPIGYYSANYNTYIKLDMKDSMNNFANKYDIYSNTEINIYLNPNVIITNNVSYWISAFRHFNYCDEFVNYNFSNAVYCMNTFESSYVKDLSFINLPDTVINLSNFAAHCHLLVNGLNKIPKNVIDISNLYQDCESITYLPDLSSNIINMAGAFWGAKPYLQISEKINIPSTVVNMAHAFDSAIKLDIDCPIDMNNALNVTDMNGCFHECKFYGNLFIKANNITDANGIFGDIITPIRRSSMLNVIVYPNTTTYNSILKAFDDEYYIEDHNVTLKKYMTDMSNYASINIPNYQTITEIPKEHIDGLYTSEVTIWDNAFSGCKNLQTVEFTNYDFTNALSVKGICSNYTGLAPKFVYEVWNNTAFDNIITAENAFKDTDFLQPKVYTYCPFMPIGKNTVTVAGICENSKYAPPLISNVMWNVDINNITNCSNSYFNAILGMYFIDISKHVIPPNVLDMSGMYAYCDLGGVPGIVLNIPQSVKNLHSSFYSIFDSTESAIPQIIAENLNNVIDLSSSFAYGDFNRIEINNDYGASLINMMGAFQNTRYLTGKLIPKPSNKPNWIIPSNIPENVTDITNLYRNSAVPYCLNNDCYGFSNNITNATGFMSNRLDDGMKLINFYCYNGTTTYNTLKEEESRNGVSGTMGNFNFKVIEIGPPKVITNMAYYAKSNIPNYQTITEIPFEHSPSGLDTSNVSNWTQSFANMTSIVSFPEPFYSVGSNSSFAYIFATCTNLVNAPTIPNEVVDMCGAFFECTNLVNAPVVIPNSVTNLQYAFFMCTNLVNAPVIPNSVTNIYYTFYMCTNLVNAPVIPNSVTNMEGTFIECTNLVNAPVIPNSVTTIKSIFRGCINLVHAPVIPNSVVNMSEAFQNAKNIQNDLIVLSNDISNAINCFSNTETYHKNIYVPYNSQTYNSFYLAMGNSITNSNWNATLIPYNSTDEIPGYDLNTYIDESIGNI